MQAAASDGMSSTELSHGGSLPSVGKFSARRSLPALFPFRVRSSSLVAALPIWLRCLELS